MAIVETLRKERLRALAIPSLARAIQLAPVLTLVLLAIGRRWMDEDAFINLRVVRNLMGGAGPVFNEDERVEAVTSPLWLGCLTVFAVLRLPLEQAAVFSGIAMTAAGLCLALDGARALCEAALPSDGRGERALSFPVGAIVYAALPPAWDYASSGLETGLGLAWLGACFSVVARLALAGSPGRRLTVAQCVAAAVLVGAGPLVRPEYALYCAAFALPLAWLTVVHGFPAGIGPALGRLAAVGASAASLPVALEVARMGYYACSVPNTALAKEAFLVNWPQGQCYLRNFFGPYRLAWPLAFLCPLLVLLAARGIARRRVATVLLAVGLPAAAAVSTAYLARIGGDYMHGRLLVTPMFVALMPLVVVREPLSFRSKAAFAFVLASTACFIWAIVCATGLRVGSDNQCGIGDERRWYARESGKANPVAFADFTHHFFYGDGDKARSRALGDCPTLAEPAPDYGPSTKCRKVYTGDAKPEVAPPPTEPSMSPAIDSRVGAVVTMHAIGLAGYRLPTHVHVIDYHGLSDPVIARFEIAARGRPGHEKESSVAWTLARFAEASDDDDQAVVAARHALHCGDLAGLLRAVAEPLTLASFADHVARAWTYAHLRIPRDPFEAEARFCGTAMPFETTAGGSGGSPFRWRCPAGRELVGMRTEAKPAEAALARIQPLCTTDHPGAAGDTALAGLGLGEGGDDAREVRCPPGLHAVGLEGTTDRVVRSVGMVCADSTGATRVVSDGRSSHGSRYTLRCPGGRFAIGVVGRSGALLDAVGIACAPSDSRLR